MKEKLMWLLLAALAVAGAYATTVLATPANPPLFTGTTLAAATFDELNIDSHSLPANLWQVGLKTKGLTDLYVQSNLWKPGGTTGWHTHPGPSLIIVTAGTITAYDADDPTCAPHVYTAGTPGATFVDPGGGHAHVLRNEDLSTDASTIAVQFLPTAAARRIDVPDPGNCPF